MLELNKAQKQIQKAVRAFAKGEFEKETVLRLDKTGDYPLEIYAKAAELGFVGIHFPERYSGGGLGIFEQALVAEELCTSDSSLGITLGMGGYGAECILRFGSDEQKKTFLPAIAEGVMLCGAAFTEPDKWYDMTKVNSIAGYKNGAYKLSGTKSHVINGEQAGFFIVHSQTDLFAQPFTDGASLFVVEADRPGVAVTSSGPRLGLNMLSSATVTFDNVKIPEQNRIGKDGKGFEYIQDFLMESRILAAAQALGLACGAYARAMAHIKGREQFKRPIGSFQVVRHKIADMATRISLVRQIVYKAASHFDSGTCDASTSAMAKLVACKAAMRVSDDAVQLLGGYGYMREYDVEHYYRDAKMIEIRDGNQYVHKDIIAESEIGKLKLGSRAK